MTTTGQETEQKPAPYTVSRAAAISAGLFAAAVLITLAALGVQHSEEGFKQQEINWPNTEIRQDPESLAAGLEAYAARHGSPNHHTFVTRVNMGETYKWIAHLDNISAHKGWYITSEGRISRNIIVPGGDLPDLRAARADPYRWLRANQPPENAQPKAPDLGNYPAYVHFRVERNVPVKSTLLIIASILTGALGLFIGVRSSFK